MTSPARAPRPTPRRELREEAHDRRAHLRVVPPTPRASRQRTRRRRTGAVVAGAVVVIFTCLMASAMFDGLLVSGQSHLDHVDAQLEQERAALAQDKLELADLQSPARIAAEAEKLGMVPAGEQHWMSPTGADPVVTGGTSSDPTTDPATDPNGTTDGTELANGGGGAGTR